MNRFFLSCVWAAALCILLPVKVANSQTVTIKEINPTHSNIGGQNATGGRVNHLGRATDTIFYAASEYGGLFKSTDVGRTWARLDAHLPTRVSSVRASPADPDLVIATSLYDGRVSSLAGINVSRDGGGTWSKPLSSSPPPGFCRITEFSAFGIAFDPEDAAHIFVGTNCGVAKSTDGGLNWTFLNPGPFASPTVVFDVVVHHGGIIDTCGFGEHRRSIDGGGTWAGASSEGKPLPAGVCSIAVSPSEPSVLFAATGTRIFETDDGGGSWNTEFVNPKPQGRVPFVVTHKRQSRNFDLWFGDVELYRARCTTPATPAPGARCPASSTWTVAGTGAHSDMGEVVFTNPPHINVSVCQQGCTSARSDCRKECADDLKSCMSKVGQPGELLASQCAQEAARCSSDCTKSSNACNTSCKRQPEGCPVVLSSDGGTYINTLTESPECQAPRWTQSNVSTRALWLWSLSGGNIPNSLTREALYMGAQDDGSFATLAAGAATPDWINPDCCDVSDTVSDSTQVLYTLCCFGAPRANRVFRRNPGMTGGGEIPNYPPEIPNYPPGNVPALQFPDVIARFGFNRYAIATTSGIFATQDITGNPIAWSSLGTNAPAAPCGLWAAGSQTQPAFYALTNDCSGNSSGTLMRYDGTSPTGTWQNVSLPASSFGVGVFAVDPNSANRLLASVFDSTFAVHMLRSSNGGTTWTPDVALDGLMNGGGTFQTQTSGYAQPTMVAFDPNDSNNLLAGAADAGIFLSRDNGVSWGTVTNNAGDAANPIIPRPHWAYFNHECSQYNIYVGTQGRGAWHLSYRDSAGTTVIACQARCESSLSECRKNCAAELTECLAGVGKPGGLLASQCNQNASQCRVGCSDTRNACRQGCIDCPQ